MSEIPDVIGGDTVTAPGHNEQRDRLVLRYATAIARDASVPVPVTGDVAYLTTPSELTIYDGTEWVPFATADQSYTKGETDALFLMLTGTAAMVGNISWAASGGAIQDGGQGLVLELGKSTGATGSATPVIDFHTGGAQDFDVRIIATGGGAGAGLGTLTFDLLNYLLTPRVGGHATSSRGFEILGYDPLPQGFGGDIFGTQTRNVVVSDVAPGAGDGMDGDVWLEY